MGARTRKFIGTAVLVIVLPVYCLVVMATAGQLLAGASTLVLTLFFLVTGLIWVLPAMALVSWMLAVDRRPSR
jgi:Protein of unknown function (DUF2842)